MTKTIRVLFGSDGWPCGVHEIASQIVRLGLGESIVHQLGDDFLKRLDDFRPHVVGVRIEGGTRDSVRNWIEETRKRSDATIILGGPSATSHPVEVLDATQADYVFAGDAEHSIKLFMELAQKPCSRNELATIPGLTYRWGDRVYLNDPGEFPATGRLLPMVGEETLRANRLDWSILEGFIRPLDSLFLTGGRGCPGRCTFCAKLHGQWVRTKPARQILEELRGADRLVQEGKLRLTRWPLYERTDNPTLKPLSVSWCSIFDEDFFLDRRRAVEFLQLYEFYGFGKRYRLGFQTNPRSLLDKENRPDAELLYWIGRVKAMIQLGAESFHPEMLQRWNKRHTTQQLETVLNALDRTGQDYNVFHLQTDYRTTLAELRESTELLLRAARRHPAMRIASSPFMIPLYDTDIRRELGFLGRLKITDYTDFEKPHPEWMPPDVVDLADRIDESLQDALYPQRRDAALKNVEAILRT